MTVYVFYKGGGGGLMWKARYIRNCLSKGDTAFLFFTDAHWGENYRISPAIMKYLAERTGIRNVFFCGDLITHSDPSKESMKSLARDFVREFRIDGCEFFPLFGNHDDNSYEQADPEAVFSMSELDEVYPVYGASSAYEAGTYYYYVDDDRHRIRYICLNTAKQKYVDYRQLKFVLNALMMSKPDSRIVIFGHIWVEWDRVARKYFPNAKTGMLLNLFDAFNACRRFGRYDFSACTSRIILVMGGHIHNEYMTFTAGGIPVILNDSDSFAKSCNRKRIIPYRQSVSAVIVQSDAIRVIKFGRGISRKITRRI